MATIGKIREKSGWVIGLIGVAMLGFIATDLFTSNRLFNGNRGPRGVGSIYGEDINPELFRSRFEKAVNNQRSQLPPDQSITPAMEGSINDQIWNELVTETVLQKEAADLGLDVTGEEIIDLCVGDNPHPLATQYLTNKETGRIDKKQIYNFITNIENNPNAQAKEFWADFETYLSNQRLREKYIGMINNAVFVTDLEAKQDFLDKNKQASIQYVPLFYTSVPDSTVKVSDDEAKDYYNAHKEDFKRDEGRTFSYVSFDVNPTKADTESASKWINMQMEPFKNTKNDSAFVVRVGRGTYENKYLPRGSYPADIEDQIFNSDSGTIIGPFYENGVYKLAKVLGSKTDSVWYFKASHILIKPNGATEADSVAAYNKAKDIYNKIKGGASFAEMAAQNSQDPGNAGKGGDLGWFREGQMVKRFNDAVKKANNGDIFLVRTEFGTHIVKITAPKTNKLVKAAILQKPVAAGSVTENAAYSAAAKFRNMVTDEASFNDAAKKMHLDPRVAQNLKSTERNIAGLENPRELIRWAYEPDTKEGSISDPKRIGDKYVVAIVTKAWDEGYAPFDDIKKSVIELVRFEKKKDMLADKLKNALDKNKNLEGIAKEVQSSVNNADNINFANAFVPNLNNEGPLVGYVFGMKVNQVSKPVKGMNGAYIVKVTSFNDIKPPQKFDEERSMMRNMQRGNVEGGVMDALKKLAEVKDYRYLYY